MYHEKKMLKTTETSNSLTRTQGNKDKPEAMKVNHSGELKYFSMVVGAVSGVTLLYPIH